MNQVKEDLKKYSRKIREIDFYLNAYKKNTAEITVKNLMEALSSYNEKMIELNKYHNELLEIERILINNGYSSKRITIRDLIINFLN